MDDPMAKVSYSNTKSRFYIQFPDLSKFLDLEPDDKNEHKSHKKPCKYTW